MEWDMGDGIHEGILSAVIPDGRTSADVRGGVVVVPGVSGNYSRHPFLPGHEVVPDDQVTGWCAVCTCGWKGPTWHRVQTAAERDNAKRLAFVPFLGHAVPSVDVEKAVGREWKAHAVPASAISELKAAFREYKQAESRVGRGVTSARAAGASWALIGAALGISRQSAHERWNS